MVLKEQCVKCKLSVASSGGIEWGEVCNEPSCPWHLEKEKGGIEADVCLCTTAVEKKWLHNMATLMKETCSLCI